MRFNAAILVQKLIIHIRDRHIVLWGIRIGTGDKTIVMNHGQPKLGEEVSLLNVLVGEPSVSWVVKRLPYTANRGRKEEEKPPTLEGIHILLY